MYILDAKLLYLAQVSSELRARMSALKKLSRVWRCGCLCLTIALGSFCSSVSAQYDTDFSVNEDEWQGIRYFGHAKDLSGKRMEDVTMRLEGPDSTHFFVTDHDGRFRGLLPLEATAGKVSVECWKEGFAAVRVTKRPGPKNALRKTVQVDCLLRQEMPS